jgi:uncharacterized YccA/Bax inhibitor family protein
MAQLRSSNPAFRHGFQTAPPAPPEGPPTAEQLSQMYRAPSRLTIDDVVILSLVLFGVLGVTGAIGWALAPSSPGVGFAAALGALALSFFIAFRRVMNPPLVVLFAVLEGFAIGMISRFYEDQYSGIVLQALLGTGVIFVVMLVLYRSRRLRATPRMRRVVYSTLMGVVALGLIDLVIRLTTGSQLPIINSSGPWGILFSLAVLVVASLQFILDFDFIEQAINAGAPRSEAWRAAYGLLIGFIWVYLELLRLLGKLRS